MSGTAGPISPLSSARPLWRASWSSTGAVSGRTDEYHPYWDIAALIGGLDEDADQAPSPADERFLAAAVARL